MLDFMRRKAQSTYIQATILIIVLVFVFWGVGTNQSGGPDAIATVNGQKISAQQFQQNYNQTINRYQEQFGGAMPPELLESLNLKQQVLNQMIQELVLRQGGADAGLIVGSDEVRKVIQNMDAFREEGIFKLDRYKTLLASSKMTTADFENSVRNDLLRSKILAHLARFARVSDSELKERFAFDHDQLKLEYVALTADAFRKSGPVAEQELAPFFERSKKAYQTESQVKIRYLSFNHDQSQQGKDLAFASANQAYEGIIQAGSLDKYAAGKETQAQATGYFSQADPPQALAGQPGLLATIFSLKKGELSSLLETKDGYAIVYLDELKAPQVMPLAEVRAKVEKDFLNEQAISDARAAAQAMLAKAKKEGSLAAVAGETKNSVLETPFFSRSKPAASGLPAEVAAQGLKLSPASAYPDKIGENGATFYVLHYKEGKPADEEEFAARKEALREMLIQEKQLQLVEAWIAHLQSRAKITTDKRFLE